MNLRRKPFVLFVVGLGLFVGSIVGHLSFKGDTWDTLTLFLVLTGPGFLIGLGLFLAGGSFIILDIVRSKGKSSKLMKRVPNWLTVIVILIVLLFIFYFGKDGWF